MIWSEPDRPRWKIGSHIDHSMSFDAKDSDITGFVNITVHTSIASHRAVPLSENDLTEFCIAWLIHKDVIETNPDTPLEREFDPVDGERREPPERTPEYMKQLNEQGRTDDELF